MSFICNYGTYGCGKSSDIIKIYHNYKKKGMEALCFRMTNDKTQKTISNKLGISCPAMPIPINTNFNFRKHIELKNLISPVDIVLIDDAHLLNEYEVKKLREVSDKGIATVCFGLRSDYKGKLYEGFINMATYCDRIEEIRGMCWCNKRAIMSVWKA